MNTLSQRYYQENIETMPVEELKKLQSEKLVKQVHHVYENVKYYRDLMDEKGVKPEDIKRILDLKVDAIISNYPDRVLEQTRGFVFPILR